MYNKCMGLYGNLRNERQKRIPSTRLNTASGILANKILYTD